MVLWRVVPLLGFGDALELDGHHGRRRPIAVHNFDVAPSTQKLTAEFFQAIACQVLVFSETIRIANAID